jgi:hypothetical protein
VIFFPIFKTTCGFLQGKILRDIKSEKGEKPEIKFQQLKKEFTHTFYKKFLFQLNIICMVYMQGLSIGTNFSVF